MLVHCIFLSSFLMHILSLPKAQQSILDFFFFHFTVEMSWFVALTCVYVSPLTGLYCLQRWRKHIIREVSMDGKSSEKAKENCLLITSCWQQESFFSSWVTKLCLAKQDKVVVEQIRKTMQSRRCKYHNTSFFAEETEARGFFSRQMLRERRLQP